MIVAEGLAEFGAGRERMIQLLTKVNTELGWVPPEAMMDIAEALGVSAAEVYSVVSFYSFLSAEARGRNIVRICNTISCTMKGQEEVIDAIRAELGIEVGETTPDGRVTLETTACIGLCDQAPAMLVNQTPHTSLTPEKAREIIAGLK
jgi:NADH:ubiquinone oxidoreductase subunit E